jgi:histone acetyltransferase
MLSFVRSPSYEYGRNPGLGPRPIIQRYTWADDIDQDTLQNIFKTVLNQVKNHHAAWPFLKPVDRAEVPDYYDVIKLPMDLKTMTERLKRGYYTHKNMFMIDMRRMLRNCRIYNGPETEYYKCADALQKFYVSKMQEFGIDAVV